MTPSYELRGSRADRTAANLRLRKHRARERQGIACATVHVTEGILTFLVAKGYLPNTCVHKADEVNAALTKFIRDSAHETI